MSNNLCPNAKLSLKREHTHKKKYCPHLSHSSKQRDEHDHNHELCEEDEWSEEGPHWPQCYVKAEREGHMLLPYTQKRLPPPTLSWFTVSACFVMGLFLLHSSVKIKS